MYGRSVNPSLRSRSWATYWGDWHILGVWTTLSRVVSRSELAATGPDGDF
jgi:hypothetical protein